MSPVEQHGVRAAGQLLQGVNRGAAQRGRHARRVDLRGTGLADGEGLDPAQRLG